MIEEVAKVRQELDRQVHRNRQLTAEIERLSEASVHKVLPSLMRDRPRH